MDLEGASLVLEGALLHSLPKSGRAMAPLAPRFLHPCLILLSHTHSVIKFITVLKFGFRIAKKEPRLSKKIMLTDDENAANLIITKRIGKQFPLNLLLRYFPLSMLISMLY